MFSPPQHKTGDLVNNKTKFRSELSTRDVLTFSRGASLNIDESPHDGLIIINKRLESVEGIWQKPLQPGVYKNMGCGSVTVTNDKHGNFQTISPDERFNTSGKNLHISVPGRSAILFGKISQFPNSR